MAGKNWLSKLQGLEGAVLNEYNPYAHIIETPSPSVNFSFGKGFGLPQGFSAVFYGPPKGGKSLLANATIGKLHRDDPEAYVVKFDTEFRENGQMPEAEAEKWGIDRSRYICYSVNSPMLIFDRISQELAAMCQDGMPLKLIVIDSLNNIMGRRAMNADTIETQQIGDEALTLQTGFKQIIGTQRKHHIGLICTAHVRAELDQLEVKRGNKVRMAASFGVQHHAEYFLYIERNRNKDARADLLGKAFEADEGAGVDDKAEVFAHKIRTVMKANSMGPAGRVGEFTLDYSKGIINVHEEVFLLGVNRGIIERPNQVTYAFDGKEYRGKPAMIEAIREYPEVQAAIVRELKKRDLEGRIAMTKEESEVSA